MFSDICYINKLDPFSWLLNIKMQYFLWVSEDSLFYFCIFFLGGGGVEGMKIL